jgi:hypothetical protein
MTTSTPIATPACTAAAHRAMSTLRRPPRQRRPATQRRPTATPTSPHDVAWSPPQRAPETAKVLQTSFFKCRMSSSELQRDLQVGTMRFTTPGASVRPARPRTFRSGVTRPLVFQLTPL